MGATHIPSAMAQMDGRFGCKIVEEVGNDGKREYFFVEKNFIDWICDVILCLENMQQTRTTTINALDAIAFQIKGADDGHFKELVNSYKDNNEEIDFRKVKGVLQNSLSMQFPPEVYERLDDPRSNLQSYEEERARKLKEMYIKNFIKAACTETQVQIVRDLRDFTVSDTNLEMFVSAVHEVVESGGEIVYADEDDKSVQRRVDELLEGPIVQRPGDANLPANASSAFNCGTNTSRGLSDDEFNSDQNNEKLQSPMLKTTAVDGAEDLVFDQPSTEQLEAGSCKNGLFGKEDWLNYYNDKIKTGTFIKERAAAIARDSEQAATFDNIEAFCDALVWLNKNGTMPDRIVGGSETTGYQIYLNLFDRDEEYAKQARTRLDYRV